MASTHDEWLSLVAKIDARRIRFTSSGNSHKALDAACEQIGRVQWADILGLRQVRLDLWSQEAREFAAVQAAVSEAIKEAPASAQIIPITVNGRAAEAETLQAAE